VTMGKARAPKDPRRPVAVWRSKELLDGEVAGALTIILRTRGCRWRRCTMCGFAAEGMIVSADDLIHQFQSATKGLSERVVKIYTSGSFLDEEEVPSFVRDLILSELSAAGVERVIIESRPEYVLGAAMDSVASAGPEIEVGIGLETSNDIIREHVIEKGVAFADFQEASRTVHASGSRVKAYLLLKPPLLSEGGAVLDAINSAREARPFADVLSLNLCNIQRGTPLERMWERGEYRPPWLWSAVEVLLNAPTPIICDPVGAGARRGPHNCGECDALFAQAIRRHALEQDASVFEGLECSCRPLWEKVIELEEYSFGTPLI